VRPFRLFALASTALALSACSSLNEFIQGDKLDYKAGAVKTAPLEVPPDLTQLAREGRYAPQQGTVSASTYQSSAAAAATAPAAGGSAGTGSPIAPASAGELRVVRDGNERWLVVPMPAEALWPQLRAFWQERGFNLVIDNAETGVMETDWTENRAKIPQDIVRRSVGRIFDSLYDSGERDRYRTRIERNGTSTEVYISHRGMQEVYTGEQRDTQTTRWVPRASDPQLEAEFLTRLMVRLGTKETVARDAVANPVTSAPRARTVAGQPATLQVDEAFDRAWRRVGLVLDRGGFTVEDRDRAGGLYFVRYVDPANAATKGEPGFFSKLFSFGKSDATAPERYRIALKADGARTQITVTNSQGVPETGPIGQRIVAILVDDLK
jgi:outer membrane protein assembly factor BamC